MYPDDSIQGILSPTPWWEKDSNRDYKRGRLVKFYAPHVDQSPFTLIPIGRNEATEHNTAHVKITPLDIRSVIRYPKLPVAALPQYKKEVRVIYRAKKRPGLIVWKKGEHPKRGRFNPDFFIKIDKIILVVEIKGDEEIAQPSDENKAKYKAGKNHFETLNEFQSDSVYYFNFLSPQDYELYFDRIRKKEFNFTSNLDAALEQNGMYKF